MFDSKDVTSCFRRSQARLCFGIPFSSIKTYWMTILPNESKSWTWSRFISIKKVGITEYWVGLRGIRTGMDWYAELRADIFCRGAASVEQRVSNSLPGAMKIEKSSESLRSLIKWKGVAFHETGGIWYYPQTSHYHHSHLVQGESFHWVVVNHDHPEIDFRLEWSSSSVSGDLLILLRLWESLDE
jgi:hypothetical protein